MSSTVWFEGLDDEARDQQFESTTARGKITGPACAARGLKRNKERAATADQLMRTSSSFKGKKNIFSGGGLTHVPAAKTSSLLLRGSFKKTHVFKQNMKHQRQ